MYKFNHGSFSFTCVNAPRPQSLQFYRKTYFCSFSAKPHLCFIYHETGSAGWGGVQHRADNKNRAKRLPARCKTENIKKNGMVRLGGLEPPTSGATNLRSNQLSYNRTRTLLRPGRHIRGVRPFCKPSMKEVYKKSASRGSRRRD